MSKRNNSRGNGAVPFVLAVIGIAALGLSSFWFVRSKEQTPPPTIMPSRPPIVEVTPRVDASNAAPSPEKALLVTIYAVEDADGGRHLVEKKLKLSEADSKTPAAAALNAIIAEPNSPLPKGTQLRSVAIKNGLATVDFSEEFQKNFSGGEEEEALTLNSVLATLGQFSTVKEVQFLVGGKKIEAIGGGQTIDEPLPVPQAAPVYDENAGTRTEPKTADEAVTPVSGGSKP